MRTLKQNFATLLTLLLASFTAHVNAESFDFISPKPISEFWLNAGFLSHHFQTDKGLNNNNLGIGGEYRYSTTSSITAGEFRNSDRLTSHYAGWYWQPMSVGAVRLGGVVGGFDGYPKMRNGGWFLAAIPMASIEYKNVGFNLAFIPTYQDRLYGALSLQLKAKLY